MIESSATTSRAASPPGADERSTPGGSARPTSGALSSFLITDIEGSTRLWEEQAAAMAGAVALHDAILRAAVEGNGGSVIKTTGDGVLAVLDEPVAALSAALDGQRALLDGDWGVARLRTMLSLVDLETAWAAGRVLSQAEAVALARAN